MGNEHHHLLKRLNVLCTATVMYQIMSPLFNRSNILKAKGQEVITDHHKSGRFVRSEVVKMIRLYYGP
jgi:hypothetical protein